MKLSRQAWLSWSDRARNDRGKPPLVLEVEIEELPVPTEHAGERRLAALPRSEERRDRGATQRGDEAAERQRAIEHGDNSIMKIRNATPSFQ